jgi:Flp pilus assembly protein TadG
MLRLTLKNVWRLACGTQGTEIVEAAVVLPLLFMLVIGVFWFGQAFRIYGTIAHAAREGARAGAAPSCSSCAAGNSPSQNAYTAIQDALAAAKLDVANAQPPTPAPSLPSCVPGGAARACDGNYLNVCIQTDVQLSSTAGAGVCGISVTFQYPYQFTFPGTSLNKQLIKLPAAARLRMETQ